MSDRGRIAFRGAIQVAGIQDEDEARMIVACGVDYLGFPLGAPIHKEIAKKADVSRMIRALRLGRRAIVITYLEKAREVSALCREVGATIVQLHGPFAADELRALRDRHPDLWTIKSIMIDDRSLPDFEFEIREAAELVDAFIVDTFDESTGARGATGKTHDWRMSRAIVDISTRPIILAGGLTPENVGRAIHAVRSAGVDVHTGVEDAAGRKSRDRVQAFVSGAREAFFRLAS
jgi:phosphoribosylanthranilate isomerase